MDQLKTMIRDYVVKEYLEEGDDREIGETTPLITGGILDSLATMKLIMFLEERYGITMQAHEADAEHLDTVALIEQLVQSKAQRAR